MSFHAGGTGARPGSDGLSATAFPSGVRNVPIEVNEAISPIVVWKKEYRQDSGGAGEFRGGLGQVMEVGTLDTAPFAISAYYDRIEHPARGREGGQDGAAGAVTLQSGAVLRGKGQQTVPQNDRVIIAMPGGGGLGNPRRRPVAVVADDVRQGFISAEAARRDYGVAVNDDGTVDETETAKLRAARRRIAGDQHACERRPADRNGRPDLSDPLLRSRERHPDRPGGREVRLRLGVGQRPHDDPELRARRVPGAAALLGAADHLRLRAVGDQDDQGRHRRAGAADAPRHRGDGQADRHARPFRQGPARDRRRHRRLSRGVQGAAARRQDGSRRHRRRGPAGAQPAVQGARRELRRQVLQVPRRRALSRSRCRSTSRSMSAATTPTTSSAPSNGPTAGCRPACMSTACGPA